MTNPDSPLRVGVLAYPGCFGSQVFGVVDLLTMGNHVAQPAPDRPPPFATRVVSPRRRVQTSSGVEIGVSAVRDLDVLVVPGFDVTPRDDLDARLAALRPEVATIGSVADAGTAVVSVCVGAFLLAEAGLLAGRRVTTSWLFADELAERCPDADVRSEHLVVHDAGVTTTAAFSAMYDFVLDLVERRCGPQAARRTARVALVDDARTSQTPYVDPDLLPASGRSFADRVRRHLDQHLRERYDLGGLAATFHVSERTLLRRYKAETGETPLAHLQRSRMRRARHLLETSDHSLREIQNAVGYRDPGSFGDLFARHFDVRPGAYRAALAAARPVAADRH